jgi:hypothetical protein
MKTGALSHCSFRSSNHSNHPSRQAWGNSVQRRGLRVTSVTASTVLARAGVKGSTHSIPRGGRSAFSVRPPKAFSPRSETQTGYTVCLTVGGDLERPTSLCKIANPRGSTRPE